MLSYAPEICTLFALNVSPSQVRQAIRLEFERNRYVSDPKVIDLLLQKGQQSFQETMNCWSQEPHILGILLAPKDRPQRSFLQKFYEGAYCDHIYHVTVVHNQHLHAHTGRDEDQVLPAASGTLAKDAVF